MKPETIQNMIQTGLPDASVQVSGDDGVHFAAVVVCPSFQGLSTMKRHRLVYACLGSDMGNAIHALQLTTKAPGE
jgi:acid stress-induced BolA-like protein IbaG/YrbA